MTGMQPKIQQYFLRMPEHKRVPAMQLRDLILAADSRVSEAIKWNQLTFSAGKENLAFIYTYPAAAYINLGFFKATSLGDPKQLFEGTGKGMRHIKIYEHKKIPATQIRKWVKEAVALALSA
jgi:hypothetical protein